jgi:hypothetical protein
VESNILESSAPQGSAGNSKIHAVIMSDLRDINRLYFSLFEKMPADLSSEMAKSIKMAYAQLNAVELSIDDDRSRLSEKEQFGLN